MRSKAGGNGCVRRNSVSDAVLVMRHRQGDKSAYDILAARHLFAVNAVVCCTLYRQRGRVDLETRDRLVQEALVKAFSSIKQCRLPNRFAQWLGRIAFRVVADDGRAIRRNREMHVSQLFEGDEKSFCEIWMDPRYGKDGVLDIVAHAEEVARLAPVVRRALKILSSRQRQIVTMWYREDMTNKEIARKLGVNERTVSSHLCEGRKRLRELLDRTENNGLQGSKETTAAGGPARRRTGPGTASARMSQMPNVPAKHAKT